MELKRVVVTGLGVISPIGNDVETTWSNALKGVSGAGPITHFDASKFKTQFACEVKNFDANEHFDRKKLRQLDLYAQYALVAAKQAVEDANLEDESINKDFNHFEQALCCYNKVTKSVFAFGLLVIFYILFPTHHFIITSFFTQSKPKYPTNPIRAFLQTPHILYIEQQRLK